MPGAGAGGRHQPGRLEWALRHACLSSYDPRLHPDRDAWRHSLRVSPVRVQWDPERSLRLAPLPYRSLQVGLTGDAVRRYVDEWVVGLTDVTGLARSVHGRLTDGDEAGAAALLPVERPYPLPAEVARVVDAG